MRRIKFTKNHKSYKRGDVISVSNNEAFGFIDRGVAIISKDMTSEDTHTADARFKKKPSRVITTKKITTKG